MINDDQAVMGMPTYILVAIIVSAAVISVFAIATYNIYMDIQYQNVRNEANKILSEAENMYEYADEGTLTTIKINLPNSMRFIVFGDLPENNNGSPPTDLNLDETTANNYYFIMNNGKMTTGHTQVRFSGEQTDEISVLYPGFYDLNLELVKENNGKTYVKIFY